MRLIDADALMEEFELAQKSARQPGRDYANAFYNNQEVCTEWWCVEEMVDNQPTVEAVPVVQDADGTLHITVKDQSAVKRVMVEEEGSVFFGVYFRLSGCLRSSQLPKVAESAPVVHGRWKGEGLTDYRCSSCGWLNTSRVRTHFCGNCGARMEGAEE